MTNSLPETPIHPSFPQLQLERILVMMTGHRSAVSSHLTVAAFHLQVRVSEEKGNVHTQLLTE